MLAIGDWRFCQSMWEPPPMRRVVDPLRLRHMARLNQKRTTIPKQLTKNQKMFIWASFSEQCLLGSWISRQKFVGFFRKSSCTCGVFLVFLNWGGDFGLNYRDNLKGTIRTETQIFVDACRLYPFSRKQSVWAAQILTEKHRNWQKPDQEALTTLHTKRLPNRTLLFLNYFR